MRLLTCFIISILLLACEQPQPSQRFSIQGKTMGTSYHVDIVPPSNSSPNTPSKEALAKQIALKLDTINELMSNWREDSEISQFNRLAAGQGMQVNPLTFDVLSLAQSISKQTQGAFDITVSPLIELWGFGVKITALTAPDPAQLQALRKNVGYEYLKLDPEHRSIQKQRDIQINLSAIAKGYAVDYISDYLTQTGFTAHLVEIGGEVRAHGYKSDGSAWRIAIEQPGYDENPDYRKMLQLVSLTDRAVATSGDYRNFFAQDGIRYSHIIDPKTARPVMHNTVSVTVIDANTARADAFATAFMVMGSKAGLDFCEQHHIAAYFIDKTKSAYETHASAAFNKYLTKTHE